MSPQPDFLRPARGTHRLSWLVCATALAVLGLAVQDAWDAWQGPDDAVAQAAALTPALRALAATRADTDAERNLRAAAKRLQRPWPEAFAALERVRAHDIRWLALDIGDSGSLRLQGQATDSRSAMAAAESLRHQGPWPDALLGRMDTTTDAAGAGLRFEITAEASQ